nr:uncharacterized protein LOC109149913 [Ipomoea trifida]
MHAVASGHAVEEQNGGFTMGDDGLAHRTMAVPPDTPQFWIPDCADENRPYVGQRFKTLDNGVQLYRSYARVGGFDVRQSTVKKNSKGEITMKYLVVSIPAQYIVPRWTQHPTTLPLIDSSPSLYDQNSGVLSAKSHRQELWRAIFGCVGLVGNSTYRMTRMGQVLQEMKAELLSDSNGQEQVMGNKHAIEALCGVVAPSEISIKPPVVAKNKGTGKRIKGKREIAIAESLKGKRKCGTCKQFARHNSRTCPMA